MRAEEIKPSMVESYQQKRLSEITYRGTPYRPASVNREVEVMRRIYSLAMREDIVLKNPCWKVTRLSEKNAKDRALTREEFNKLLRELPRHAADIVTVAYYTGMRAGEIYGMTWERVNMKQGYFNLTQKDTKTGEARHVYFSGAVREILERLEKIRYISHNFVFTYRGKPLKSIKVCFARALKKAKIKDFKFYDLRHTFTTNARKAGVGDSVVMKLTGHKTMSMFICCNTVDSADARQALKLMEDYSGEEERGTTANSTVGAKKGSGAIS
jgi:integrase